MFIRKDVKGQAQLVLLDHGLYDKLTQDDRQSLCSLYKAIVLNKEDNMQKFSKALGVDGKWLLGTKRTGLFQIKYLLGFLMGVGVDGFLFESRA